MQHPSLVFLRPPKSSNPSRSSYPPVSSSSSQFTLFFAFPSLLGGCRRQGTGLVLDHGTAASSGPTMMPVRRGPCKGGRSRGRSGLSRTPARTPSVSEESLRGAGGWRNRLLAVTDDDGEGVAVLGQNRAPFKGVVGQFSSIKVCHPHATSQPGRRGVVHVVTWRGHDAAVPVL